MQERLDWLLILNRGHLERVLRVYVDHYSARTRACNHHNPTWHRYNRPEAK